MLIAGDHALLVQLRDSLSMLAATARATGAPALAAAESLRALPQAVRQAGGAHGATGWLTWVGVLSPVVAALTFLFGVVRYRKGVHAQRVTYELQERSKILDLLLELNRLNLAHPAAYDEFLKDVRQGPTSAPMTPALRASSYYHLNMFDRALLYLETIRGMRASRTFLSRIMYAIDRRVVGPQAGLGDGFERYWDRYVGQVMYEHPRIYESATTDTKQLELYSPCFLEHLTKCRDAYEGLVERAPSLTLVQSRDLADFAQVMADLDFEDAYLLAMLRWCGIRDRDPALLRWEVYLVKDVDTTVGVCGLYAHAIDPPTRAWVGWFGIRPAYRRRGRARGTLALLAERARAAGHDELWVFTDAANVAAHALYQGAGFTRRGTGVNFPPPHTFAANDVVYGRKL